ncbi:amidophosphoribosyltransferase [Amphibiibacter pelophylacis]|uniref:Amidophosphoribosyltransferase n=1 Tax=Amphibiibacter pelophylacis TaxID=1799477 RepID=A0ACC6P3C7_9BURK
MCGIVGAVSSGPVNQLLYDALLLLQHRGQDAAGMVTLQGQRCHLHKARGMVRDVFRTRNMRALPGNTGLGQVRYPTAGNAESEEEAQPFYVNAPFGLALVHNGNLTNAVALKRALFEVDRRHINTDSDSEVLLNVFAHELGRFSGVPLTPDAIFRAVSAVHRRVRGSYAVVALIAGQGLVAFRDPKGIRPLSLGRGGAGDETTWMVASESVAIEGVGLQQQRDVAPGEAIFIDQKGQMHSRQCADQPELLPCLFEFVYLARPDSVLDGVSVYRARLNMGETLAQRVINFVKPADIDVVIPIPESSRPSAMQLAHRLGKPYREGFVKNRYVGRTFIMPGQAVRRKSVRQKLNAIAQEFSGRNVLLVDDSIVRGTTSKEIVQMARDAGANKVYLASAAPPVRFSNIYGIDMPTQSELVAHDRSLEEIRTYIGCDALIYQDLDALKSCVASLNPAMQRFEASCFSGEYVHGEIVNGQWVEGARDDLQGELFQGAARPSTAASSVAVDEADGDSERDSAPHGRQRLTL